MSTSTVSPVEAGPRRVSRRAVVGTDPRTSSRSWRTRAGIEGTLRKPAARFPGAGG